MFEGFGTVLAGLGLFLAGLRMLSSSLAQISSRSIRGLFKWVNNRFLGIIWGILAGAVSQSAAGITFIVSTMVSSRIINVRSGLSIVGWVGVGTSFLVFLVICTISQTHQKN
jgi:Na+/phosphate symporter